MGTWKDQPAWTASMDSAVRVWFGRSSQMAPAYLTGAVAGAPCLPATAHAARHKAINTLRAQPEAQAV